MKTMLKGLVFLVVVLVMTGSALCVSAYDNLVTNGSFDTNLSGWYGVFVAGTKALPFTDTANGSSSITAVSDIRVGSTGYGMSIYDNSTGTSGATRALQTIINIDPTKSYKFVYYIRSNQNNSIVQFRQENSSGTPLITETITTAGTNNVFVKVERTISPLSATSNNIQFNSQTARVTILLYATEAGGNLKGTTYYDNISLTQSSEFFVATSGNDTTGDGSIVAPFATIERARDYVRTIKGTMTENIYINIRGGEYEVTSPIVLGASDSGNNGYSVIYRAYNDEDVKIIGGKKITNWVDNNGIWSADLSSLGLNSIRNLYIDSKRMQRARSSLYKGMDWYNDTNTTQSIDGVIVNEAMAGLPSTLDLSSYNVEFGTVCTFVDYKLPLASYTTDAKGNKQIGLKQPYAQYYLENTTGQDKFYIFKFDKSFWLENAYDFMDEQGEWCYNKQTKTIYYKPITGQSISAIQAYIPTSEGIMKIEGNSATDKVMDIGIEKLNFLYGSWDYANDKGMKTYQAEVLFENANSSVSAYSGNLIMPQILIKRAKNISFTNNIVRNIGSTALGIPDAAENITVTGNEFTDISAAAISVGIAHAPQLAGEEIVKNIVVSNNLIRQTGQEYYGAPAVAGYYTNNLSISNNDIAIASYSGISMGWGWGVRDLAENMNNSIENNKIVNTGRVAQDGGGIYTLGKNQNGVISGNVIDINHGYIAAALYFDAGSKNHTATNNIMMNAQKWFNLNGGTATSGNIVQSSYATTSKQNNTNISGNTVEDATVFSTSSIPSAVQSIIDSSGLQSGYTYMNSRYQAIYGVETTDPVAEMTKSFPATNEIVVNGWQSKAGGQGVAYYDTTAGNYWDDSWLYTTDIDVGMMLTQNMFAHEIEATVGCTTNGEWIKYDVVIPTNGTYTFKITTISNLSTTATLSFDGVAFKDTQIPIGLIYSYLDVGTRILTAGTHEMKLQFNGPFVLDKIIIKKISEPPIIDSSLKLWLDGNDSTTITKDANNKVTAWNDKSGNNNNATIALANAPTYNATGLNDMGTIDFGAKINNLTGKYMDFTSINDVRTAFVVWKTYATTAADQFMLGHSTNYHFHRGLNSLWDATYTNAYIRNGNTYLNGSAFDGINYDVPDSNYSITTVVTTGNVSTSALARNRSFATGGNDYAEVLLYNRALNEAERMQVENYLSAKWGIALSQ